MSSAPTPKPRPRAAASKPLDVRREDVRPFLDRIGVLPDGWGCRRGIPGQDSRNHGPAIEVYLSHRYFAVTTSRWPGAPEALRLIDAETLDALAELIPAKPRAAAPGGDTSRSALAFRKALALRRSGKTYDEMVEALRADPETADWAREKGEPNGQRELPADYGRRRPAHPSGSARRSATGSASPATTCSMRCSPCAPIRQLIGAFAYDRHAAGGLSCRGRNPDGMATNHRRRCQAA